MRKMLFITMTIFLVFSLFLGACAPQPEPTPEPPPPPAEEPAEEPADEPPAEPEGPPDLTGQLFGTVLSLQPVLGSSVSLAYRPDYLDDRMSGEVVAGATVRVYRLLSELLIFAWRLPKIRLLRLYQQLQKGG